MGDFNMSFFRVIPELRSRGATIDLAAWYPWKKSASRAQTLVASFAWGGLGYQLKVGLQDIHQEDKTGFLSHFPVVFFTKNPCRRSPDACERRRRKQLEQKSDWGTWA